MSQSVSSESNESLNRGFVPDSIVKEDPKALKMQDFVRMRDKMSMLMDQVHIQQKQDKEKCFHTRDCSHSREERKKLASRVPFFAQKNRGSPKKVVNPFMDESLEKNADKNKNTCQLDIVKLQTAIDRAMSIKEENASM